MYDVLNAYLENGLKIILHKISDVKTISCGLWIKQGSAYETDKNNGLSHLTEHLMLNPDDVMNEKYAELLSRASAEGVRYNAATTKEYTCYYFTGLKHTLEICLSCLANIAKNNRSFREESFDKEKNVVLQEAASFYSSFQQIKERTSQAIWGNMGTGKIIMGNMSNISNAKPEKILELVENSYVPENAILVVIGNIDYTQILPLIEERFGSWEDNSCKMAESPVESTPGIYLNQGSGGNLVFSVGFRAPAYHERNRVATEMMVQILGNGGLTSRIVQELRIKRGLVYTSGGFSSFYKRRGTLGFMAVCDKEKTIDVTKIMMDVLASAKEKGFTEEEMEREKRMMETSMLLSVDNITEHLRYIGKCSVMDRNFYIENEVRAIRNVQLEEINNAAKEMLQESNMGLAAIGECDTDELLNAVAI